MTNSKLDRYSQAILEYQILGTPELEIEINSLKAELEQELENSIPFLHGDCDNEKRLEQENKRLEELEDECVKGAVRMIKLENENKELKNGMSDFKKIVDENNNLKEKYNNQYETTLELREDRLRDKEKLEQIKEGVDDLEKALEVHEIYGFEWAFEKFKQILDEESKE